MKKERIQLTLRKDQFWDWYFNSGQDSENESIKEKLAEDVINSLGKTGTYSISIEKIFSDCNQDAIRMCYFDGFPSHDERELSDYLGENKRAIINLLD